MSEIAEVTKSNRLDLLVQELKGNLYSEDTALFEKRVIAVPHMRLKLFLTRALASDMQVAAGLTIVNLNQAWSILSRKAMPTHIELSLFLQHALQKMEFAELAAYFDVPSKERRIGPFADACAHTFLQWGLYGKKAKAPRWQEELWREVKKIWSFPIDGINPHFEGQIHLFGFDHVPSSLIDFFAKGHAQFYFFSPCRAFWGDLYSEKEKGQLDLFGNWFGEDNLLLSNWGRLGRKTFLELEDLDFPTDENYVEPKRDSTLGTLQYNVLDANLGEVKKDRSVRLFSATSKRKEVEGLKRELLTLGVAPGDIQIVCPDISSYAPHIQEQFEGSIPYVLSDLKWGDTHSLARGFSQLMNLPKERFSAQALIALFWTPIFMEKWGLNGSQIDKIERWVEKTHIHWGISTGQKRHLLDSASTSQGTWMRGIETLLCMLAESMETAISWSEVETLDVLYRLVSSLDRDLTPCFDGTRKTIPTWIRTFAGWIETYFACDPTDDYYRGFVELAAKVDTLDEREVTYLEVERIWKGMADARKGSIQSSLLDVAECSQFSVGGILPSKVICLLGMDDSAFPRKVDHSSLLEQLAPTTGEIDRYLALEALCQASDTLIASCTLDREGKVGPSIVLQELLRACNQTELEPYEEFQVVPQPQQGMLFSLPELPDEVDVDVKALFRFARHPLRFFLKEELGIELNEWGDGKEDPFLLSPLEKYKLVQESLRRPFATVWEEAKEEGRIPLHLCTPLAREQMEAELVLWQEALANTGGEFSSFDLDRTYLLEDGKKIRLKGTYEMATPNALLVRGEDPIALWAHQLIAKQLGLSLYSIKAQEPLRFETGTMEAYLSYFLKARSTPSLFLPSLSRPLIEGSAVDFEKAVLKEVEKGDEPLAYLLARDPKLDLRDVHNQWSEELRRIFRREYANL